MNKPPSGGPAAIHGFLYQFMLDLDAAAALSIEGTASEDEWTLTLEPASGGDAHLESSQRRVIQQAKSRSGDTWSLREVVDRVLVDFCRAAQAQRTDADTYEFITDGRLSHLVSFGDFLTRRRERRPHEDRAFFYAGIGQRTDSGLLDWMRKRVQATLPVADEVFEHVVDRLQLSEGIDEAGAAQRVDAFLRQVVPDPSTAPQMRDTLLGMLMGHLAKGAWRGSPRELFRESGVDVGRLERVATLAGRLGTLNDRIARATFSYNATWDVRPPPAWRHDAHPILVLTGRAGTGKSWQLASLAAELSADGVPAVIQPVAGNIRDALAAAANTVWNDALQTATVGSISSIRQALRFSVAAPIAGRPWLVVLLDGPVSDSDLSTLVSMVAAEPDLRVVLTMDEASGARMVHRYPSSVARSSVGLFTTAQLQQFLERRNVPWPSLPKDLMEMLNLPLLAGLYAKLEERDFHTRPSNEYQLFDGLWAQATHSSGTATILRTLANSIRGDDPQRAQSLSVVTPPVQKELLESLSASGWIALLPGDELRFSHSRLAQWAAADAAVAAWKVAPDNVEALWTSTRWIGQTPNAWGYVLMDVVWKLCQQGAAGLSAVVDILLRLETEPAYADVRIVYEDLLPSIGAPCAQVIGERVRRGCTPYILHLCDTGLRTVGRRLKARGEATLVETARHLLEASEATVARLGLTLVDAAALNALADLVWTTHKKNIEASKTKIEEIYAARWSYPALRTCATHDAAWLQDRILDADDNRHLRTLGSLLLELPHANAAMVWAATREKLATLTGEDGLYTFHRCIGRFRDRAFIDRVCASLDTGDDYSQGQAFAALVSIDPDEAIKRLSTVSMPSLSLHRMQWARRLHAEQPKRVEDWLVAQIRNGDALEIYEQVRHVCDAAVHAALLQGFVARWKNKDDGRHLRWLSLWARHLSERPEQLATLRGTATEAELLEQALCRVGVEFGEAVWERDWLMALLVGVGGDAVGELVRAQLRRGPQRFGEHFVALAPMLGGVGMADALAHRVPVGDSKRDAQREDLSARLSALTDLGAADKAWDLLEVMSTDFLSADAIAFARGGIIWTPERVAVLRERIEAGPDAELAPRIRALYAAAMAPTPELVAAALEAVRREPGSAPLANHAALLFKQFPPDAESLAAWAAPLLRDPATAADAGTLLLRCGTNAAHEALLRWVTGPDAPNISLCAQVAGYLPASSEAGSPANDFCRALFLRQPAATSVYPCVARLEDSEIMAELRARAYDARNFFVTIPLTALRVLAAVDPHGACDAALWALTEKPDTFEKSCPYTVMQLGTAAHILALLEVAIRAQSASLWEHVGRAARRGNSSYIEEAITALSDHDAQLARAELSGWQEQNDDWFLEAIAAGAAPRAHEALLKSRALAGRLRRTKHLIERVRVEHGAAAVALLHAILEQGDPFLLHTNEDALFLESALGHLNPSLTRHADTKLKTSRQNWKPLT